MTCPFCGHRQDRVIDSRESKEGDVDPPPPRMPKVPAPIYHLRTE